MATKLLQRTVSTSDDTYGSETVVSKEEEKTIPFLRRLVDMLNENDEVISFSSGSVRKGQVTLGRIVVHDRVKVEAEVLPKYFNHSSFASLRRQLNYFSFTRLGKGRQRGATYCNEGVIALEDILRLKRRSSVGGVPTTTPSDSIPAEGNGKRQRSVSLSNTSLDSSSNGNDYETPGHRSKKPRPMIVSPRSSPVQDIEEEPRITLDLTVPNHHSYQDSSFCTCTGEADYHGDADVDVLAGCRALLSFARGFSCSN